MDSLGKSDSHIACNEVVSLITSFFTSAKPAGWENADPSSWFSGFGSGRCCDLRVYLSLFDKLAPIKEGIDNKFRNASDECKRPLAFCQRWATFIV